MPRCPELNTFIHWNKQNKAGLPENCPARGDQKTAAQMPIKDCRHIPEKPEGMSYSEYLKWWEERDTFVSNIGGRVYSSMDQLDSYTLQADDSAPLCNLCSQLIGRNEEMAKWRQMFGSKDSYPSGANSQRGNKLGVNPSALIDGED